MKRLVFLILSLALLILPHLVLAQCVSWQKPGSDLRVTSAENDSYWPSLSWTGSEFGVSWFDSRDGNSEIYFARLDAAGVMQGSEIRITSDSGESMFPALAWTESEFGVAWFDARDGNPEI